VPPAANHAARHLGPRATAAPHARGAARGARRRCHAARHLALTALPIMTAPAKSTADAPKNARSAPGAQSSPAHQPSDEGQREFGAPSQGSCVSRLDPVVESVTGVGSCVSRLDPAVESVTGATAETPRGRRARTPSRSPDARRGVVRGA